MEQVTEVTSFKKSLVSAVIFIAFLGMLVAILGFASSDWRASATGLFMTIPGFVLGRRQIKEIFRWIVFEKK